MNSLYEISENYKAVLEMLYDPEEDQQCILDTLEGIDGEFEAKADTYAKLIKNLQADVKALEDEEKRMRARRNTLEIRAQGIKDALEFNMREIGKTKFKTTLFSYNIQKNGGLQKLSIDVEDVKDIPEEYTIPQDPIPNNDAIRSLLATEQVTWAHLEPRGETLRIR